MSEDDVRLTDLEVIARYSIAVRAETADRAELLDALLADVLWLQQGSDDYRRVAPVRATAARPRTAARPSAPARRTAAKPAKSARGRR
ncbi:MAG: hypothetical protein ABR520_01740 [Mycobacteriales bacterium]|nr:hypothetical protein [Frankia sp.]